MLGLGDETIDQHTPESAATKLRTNIEPLHLAHARLQRPERDASRGLVVIAREQKTALWRGVHRGEIGQLLGETLKAEIDVEGGSVLLEQTPGLLDLAGGDRVG